MNLPIVLPPYPGEVLGSWLARCLLHNGEGAWKALLRSVGLSSKLTNAMFDMVPHSSEFETLLVRLGMSYERAMLEMTSLPFWLSFEAGPPGGEIIPGTAGLPKPLVRGKVPITLAHIGQYRSLGENIRGRFCPTCLDEDIGKYGEAYWHRDHQLSNVFFCPRHFCATRIACEKCGRIPSRGYHGFLELPRLRCECGHDLRTSGGRVTDSPFVRLAKLSEQALSTRKPEWHRGQVKAFSEQLIAEYRNRYQTRTFVDVIAHRYGPVRRHAQGIYLKVPGAVEQSLAEMRLSCYLGRACATDFCALLVAADMDWESARTGFIRTVAGKKPGSEKGRCLQGALTIDVARQKLLRIKALRLGKVSSGSGRAYYWFLRINDPEWLSRIFPEIQQRRMATMAADRRQVRAMVDRILPEGANREERIKVSLAGIRAAFRDKMWLDAQLDRLRTHERKRGLRGDRQPNDEKATAMVRVLQGMLSESGRPYRITLRKLAQKMGIPVMQCSRLVRTDSGLAEAVHAARNGYQRRILWWSAQQLLKGGRKFGRKAIVEHAKVPQTEQVTAILDEIMAAYEDTNANSVLRERGLAWGEA